MYFKELTKKTDDSMFIVVCQNSKEMEVFFEMLTKFNAKEVRFNYGN